MILDDLTSDFNARIGKTRRLGLAKTGQALAADFARDFAGVAALIEKLNAILRERSDPSAKLEITWCPTVVNQLLTGHIVAARSGFEALKLDIGYQAGRMHIHGPGVADGGIETHNQDEAMTALYPPIVAYFS